ncbi:MAG TPA: hypothetical protein DDY61_07355 [Ruminococcaceae bacterium]|nr:hypothetical protein [Oscillospiraceae bacterium]
MLNIFIGVIGAVLITAGIVFAFVKSLGKKALASAFLIIGAVVLVGAMSFSIVPTGYTGVRTTFGQISENTVPQGFNLKVPLVQNIKLVNNKQQDVKISSQIWGETAEKTPVYASDIVVTYQISNNASAWIFRNISDTNNLISDSLVASAAKSAMVEMKASEVTNRTKIEPMVKEKLISSINEKYGEDRISILKVVVNQMDFEEDYNKAIAEKSIAQQTKEKQAIENETAVAKAEADKQVAITNAQAKADATRIAAEAEAEANEKIKNSLNDQIIKSKFYDKWDGKLPEAMGSDTVITKIGE